MSLVIIRKSPSCFALRAFRGHHPTTAASSSFHTSLLGEPQNNALDRISSSFWSITSRRPRSSSWSIAFYLPISSSSSSSSPCFSSSTSSKPSGRKGDECEESLTELPSPSGEEGKSDPPAGFSKAKDHKHLTPEKRGHWRLMDSADKASVSIPVFSTVSKAGENDAAEASSGHKPVSMWPGMYHSPVTAALWAARSSILERAMEATADGHPQRELLTKTPAQSRTSILYSFSNDQILQEQYRNPWGGIRIGKLLEDLDALAGTIAVKHCADDDYTTRPLMLVTASVDKISLFKPLNLTDDLTIAGAVAWVGRSSMEIRMEVCQASPGEESKEESVALIANFTFVARDSISKKAAQINRLMPETSEEKRLFQLGETRDAKRKHLRTSVTEVSKAAKAVEENLRLKSLLAEGRVLKEMPTLADRNVILVKDTKLENAIICQPQQRNMHGRIFGGFLMRRAYELAYSTCYVFCGTKPVFLEVDHVDFLRPVLSCRQLLTFERTRMGLSLSEVDVGNLLRFKSCVLSTEETQLMHIEVTAHVTQPELRTSEVSNTFYFTFTVDEDLLTEGSPPIFRVVPGSEEEARRVLARSDAENLAKYPLLEKQLSQKSLK